MPRVVDHEQRRTEIALGVLQVIAEGGLAAVSLRSVATASGVSMGRVQHYFATKHELVLHACRTVMDLAERRYEQTGAAPARERLRDLLLMGLPASPPGRAGVGVWYTFVVAALTDPELAGLVAEGWRNLRDEAAKLLAEDGAGDETAADSLAALMDGLVLRVALGSITVEQAHRVVDRQLEVLPP